MTGKARSSLCPGDKWQRTRPASSRELGSYFGGAKSNLNYNPDLFWDADPANAKEKIAAGPNNPVGVVWIGLNEPHYGYTARLNRERSAIPSLTGACG